MGAQKKFGADVFLFFFNDFGNKNKKKKPLCYNNRNFHRSRRKL